MAPAILDRLPPVSETAANTRALEWTANRPKLVIRRPTTLRLRDKATDAPRCLSVPRSFHARPHRRAQGHTLYKCSFGACRLCFHHRLGKSFDVFHKRVLGEACLADARMQNACFSFETRPSRPSRRAWLGDVHRHVPTFGFGIMPRGPKFYQAGNQGHHVGRRDALIEVDVAALNLRHQIGADNVGSGGFASSAFAPRAKTATRTERPVPFGSAQTPRTI